MSLQRERTVILTLLLILAAVSWAILIWQSRTANTMGMGLTMGMGAALFLVFARTQRDHHRDGSTFVSTWVFVGAYLLIWALFGVVAYLGANASSGLAQQVS